MTRAPRFSVLTIVSVPAIVAGAVLPHKAIDIGTTGIPALANSTMASDEPSSNKSGLTGQFTEENMGLFLSFSSSPTTADANLICHLACFSLRASCWTCFPVCSNEMAKP